jgi:hypothetical protein
VVTLTGGGSTGAAQIGLLISIVQLIDRYKFRSNFLTLFGEFFVK